MIIKAIKSTLTLWPNEGQIKPLTRSQKETSKYKYTVSNTYKSHKYTDRLIKTSKQLNLADQKTGFKFTCFNMFQCTNKQRQMVGRDNFVG